MQHGFHHGGFQGEPCYLLLLTQAMFLRRKAALPAAAMSPSVADVKPRLKLEPCRVSDEQAARRVSQANDDVLQERTVKWLAALPANVRPTATAQQYPRIVNRIDNLWGQCEYTRLYFQSLLIDRRKGRRGFPPEVRRELEALQHYYFEYLSRMPAILWNAVPVYAPRIPDRAFAPHPDTTEIEIPPLSSETENSQS